MADENAVYKVSLIDKYSSKLEKMLSSSEGFKKSLVSLGKTLGVTFAAGAAVKGIYDMGKASLKLAGNMEQTEIAFNTFLGSAKKGGEVLDMLNEFANVTPYTNDEIIKTGRALLAANVPAEQMTDTLKMIGNVAAGANIPITDLGNIYAKVMNKGKMQAEELNQMAERGIPIIDQLSKTFGVTKQEVFKLGSQGKISSAVMVKAFQSMTSKGGKFYQLMEKQSESAVGLMSTLGGKTDMLAISIGKRMLPAQKKMTKIGISLVDMMNDWVKVPVAETLKNEQREVYGLTAKLTSANTTEDERRKILEQLKKINPDIVKGINAENVSTELLSKNLEKYNANMINKIALATLDEKDKKAAAKASKTAVELSEVRADALVKVGEIDKKISLNSKLTEDQKIDAAKRYQDTLVQQLKDQKKLIWLSDQQKYLGSAEDRKQLDIQASLSQLYVERNRLLTKYNKQKKESVKMTKRVEAMRRQFELDTSETQKTPTQMITGKIEGADDVTAGITKITSAAPKTFNINIDKLIEKFEVSTTNLNEGVGEIRRVITDTLLEALADTQPLVR